MMMASNNTTWASPPPGHGGPQSINPGSAKLQHQQTYAPPLRSTAAPHIPSLPATKDTIDGTKSVPAVLADRELRRFHVQITCIFQQLCPETWGVTDRSVVEVAKVLTAYEHRFGELPLHVESINARFSTHPSELMRSVPYVQIIPHPNPQGRKPCPPPLIRLPKPLESVVCPCASQELFLSCMWCCQWRLSLAASNARK